jgi:hypothetical protein
MDMTVPLLTWPRDAVAVLALSDWRPDPALVAVTDHGRLLVVVGCPGGVIEREFSPSALAPPLASDPPGVLVLVEDGERLVVTPDGDDGAIGAFAAALSAARDTEPGA